MKDIRIEGPSLSLSDTWLKEFEEASKLADDIAGRLRERENIVSSGGDPSQLITSTRRKITALGTCLDRLESLLQNPPEKPVLNEVEVYRRHEMLLGLRYRTKQMAASVSTSSHRTALSGLGEAMAKKTLVPVKADITESLSLQQAMTRTHLVGDPADDSSVQDRLLPFKSPDNQILESHRKDNDYGIDDADNTDSCRGCNMQLLCLIILGIGVLILLIWTIIKIF
ncbi:hypothetical protein KP509_35G005200 [Ceratopteris richardii]|uniref:Uncharacterized protein n=1 Tax=Ceratopteris richardii TaxID=49495 RepID=A0A8T2QDL2_CERRI|nr:hypothetical protein KP509_35G005200 [Ceratopteris richardii]